MKKTERLWAIGQGRVEFRSADLPPLAPGQVLLETLCSAISPGTELALIHEKPGTPGVYPASLGYSACCRILARAEDVAGLEIGQRVACQSPHASYHVCEAGRCVPVPEAVSDTDATIYRLAAIALQGVRKAQVELGSRVAVQGLGPIGNLAGQLCRANGACHVAGVDPLDWRRQLALEAGFDAALAPGEAASGEGFDRVIEATGIPGAIPAAFQMAARRGVVVLLGSPRGETEKVDFYRDVHKKGLTIVGAHEFVRPAVDDHRDFWTSKRDNEVILQLMAAQRIRHEVVISDVIKAREAPSAYARLASGTEHLLTVVLQWR